MVPASSLHTLTVLIHVYTQVDVLFVIDSSRTVVSAKTNGRSNLGRSLAFINKYVPYAASVHQLLSAWSGETRRDYRD